MSRFAHAIRTYRASLRPPNNILSFIHKCDFRSNHWASHWLWIHRRPCPHLSVQHGRLTSLWKKNSQVELKGHYCEMQYISYLNRPLLAAWRNCNGTGRTNLFVFGPAWWCSGYLWLWLVSSMVKCHVGVTSHSTPALYKIGRCDSWYDSFLRSGLFWVLFL